MPDEAENTPPLRLASLEVMFRAVEKVRERLHRSAEAIQSAGIPYGIIGANAVAFWVAKRDEGAVRNTPNVDLLVSREDAPRVRTALEAAGFVLPGPRERPSLFLDGPDGRVRQAVRVWYSGDTIGRATAPLPDVRYTLPTFPYRVISLPMLVRMKLSAFRTIDRVHLGDMVLARLLDAGWLANFPHLPDPLPELLAERLRQILANPEGHPEQSHGPGGE